MSLSLRDEEAKKRGIPTTTLIIVFILIITANLLADAQHRDTIPRGTLLSLSHP